MHMFEKRAAQQQVCIYIYTFLFILAYYYSTIDKYHTTNNNIYIIIIIVMAIVIGMSDAFTLSAQKARTRICYQCEKYSMWILIIIIIVINIIVCMLVMWWVLHHFLDEMMWWVAFSILDRSRGTSFQQEIVSPAFVPGKRRPTNECLFRCSRAPHAQAQLLEYSRIIMDV